MNDQKFPLCQCSKLSRRTRWALWSAASLAGVAVAWTTLSATESPATPTPAPAWMLHDVNGKTISSADFKGKVVVLDFWATWCPPCRAEIPGFIELQNQYGKDGVEIIGVSVDGIGQIAAVKKFAERLGVNYPVALADEATVHAFGDIEAIPTTFVIDREGRIADRHMGFVEKADLEKEIKTLLRRGN